MTKVLLVNPNVSRGEPPSPPLGLLYLAGTLVERGVNVKMIDGYLNRASFDDELEKALNEFKPDIAGVTMLTFGRGASLGAASRIKLLRPDTTVVVGGVHPSLMYKDLLCQNACIDLAVIGEGEETMLEIAKGNPFSAIDGIAYRSDGDIATTRPRRLISNLDAIPFPAWHLADLSKYPPVGRGIFNGVLVDDTPRIGVAFSRGCSFICTFCSVQNMWRSYRHRSGANMADELELLNKKFNIKHFRFVDDLGTQDKNAFMELCGEITKRRLTIAFEVTTRSDFLSEELLLKMKEAGCYRVIIGVESGSDEILKKINKMTTRRDNELAMELIKRAGMDAVALLMIGNEGETRQTINETVDFLRHADPDEIGGVCGVLITPGTAVCRMAKGKKLIDDEYWKTDKDPPLYTAGYTMPELRSFQRAIQTRVRVPPEGSFLVGNGILDMLINIAIRDNRLYRLKVAAKLVLNYIRVRIRLAVHYLKTALFRLSFSLPQLGIFKKIFGGF